MSGSKNSWHLHRTNTVELPPGEYYVGDLCYGLRQDLYDGVFGAHAYTSGLYTSGKDVFLVGATAYGDGSYRGSDKFNYLVDAGIIGIASASLIDQPESFRKKSPKAAKMWTFKYAVRVVAGPVFKICRADTMSRLLTIDTALGSDDECEHGSDCEYC